MNKPTLGLACLATLSLSTAAAVEEYELQKADADGRDLVIGLELLNSHHFDAAAGSIHDDVTARGSFTGRYWDIGLHIDGWLAVDGNDNRAVEPVGTGEMIQFNLRLDYLMEGNFGTYGVLQVLPHLETVLFPDLAGNTRFNWAGVDTWYGLPWQEGLEVGASVDFNLVNDTQGARNVHELRGSMGARWMYQDAPVDLMVWGLLNWGNRAYHDFLGGDPDQQGFTVFNLGAKATLPLPWEECWTFLRLEGSWWMQGDDRDALKGAGGDANEIVIGIGFEWRPE